jgi:uncharacterized protein
MNPIVKTFADIAFTPAVRALQSAHGSRAAYARMQDNSRHAEGLGDLEAEFLSKADSIFIATVSETGWPYVQHRGGPRGFLKVISPQRIAFGDFRGNRQYVSAGNASRVDRVAIIVMDYAAQRRLKLLGRLRFEDVGAADRELLSAVSLPGYRASVERVALIDVEAFDWNCPQHIPQRYTRDEVEAALRPLQQRIAELEDQLTRGRAGGEPPNR